MRHAAKAAASVPPASMPALLAGPVPRRQLGATGLEVSISGIGGSHLGQADSLDEAKRIVDEAVDAGVNFFDNAWEYNDGRSEDWLGKALVGKRNRCKPTAADGRYEPYKVSLQFDNPEARLAHDFPVDSEQMEIKEALAYSTGKGAAAK